MLRTTVGQLLVNNALPPEMRDHSRVLTGTAIQELFDRLAKERPDDYPQVLKDLGDVGRQTFYRAGGASPTIDSLRQSKKYKIIKQELEKKIDSILSNPRLSEDAKHEEIVKVTGEMSPRVRDEIYEESVAENNPLALQILSGAKGSKMNLASLRGADLLYSDHRDNIIPFPVLRSYSQGLSPADFFASSFGARKGVVDTKLGTAQAGFLGKILAQASHRLAVVKHDTEDFEYAQRGMPVDTSDNDSEGSLLSYPAGGYTRNTALTPRILRDLRSKGIDRIVVRSPITGGPAEGGIYAADAGIRERGGLPSLGEQVGLAAAQAAAEPISQGGLCLAEGTLVRMADWSVKPIQSVVVGDLVLGSDCNGRTSPVEVLKTYDSGPKECVQVDFRVGSSESQRISLTATASHEILATVSKWQCEAQQDNGKLLRYRLNHVGRDFFAVLPAEFDDVDQRIGDRFALFLGLVLGDGCFTESVKGAYLSCADLTLLQDLEPYLSPLNLKLTKMVGRKYDYRFSQIEQAKTPQDDSSGRFVGSYRNPAMQYLGRHGLLGRYSYEKTIPDEAYHWDNASVSALLAGLFVTDGCVMVCADNKRASKPYVSFASTSCRMTEQVRELLAWRFGIHCASVRINRSARKRPLYSVQYASQDAVLRFFEHVPLYGVKARLLSQVVDNWVERSANLDRYRCKRIATVKAGLRETYDIEVGNPDHLFVLANGLIVSNSSKHSGGIAGAAKAVSGFKMLESLVQIPKVYPGGAAHAKVDGRVESVKQAPAGGQIVTVQGEPHYVHQGLDLKVKPGDTVEAGDTLSEGDVNPAEVVQHKGIGEGRRQLAHLFRSAMKDAGLYANRRNTELLARGLVNHVRLTDEMGPYVPDDIVPYDVFEHSWEPRADAQKLATRKSLGKYLEKPILHYSIGTRIKPSVIKELEHFGIREIHVHDQPPPFEPEMVRGQDALQHDPDWLTRQLGSNLHKGLAQAVARGAMSDAGGSSYVPALVNPESLPHFGQQGALKKPGPATSVSGGILG